jgi:uncharacterized protein (DUF302 family)
LGRGDATVAGGDDEVSNATAGAIALAGGAQAEIARCSMLYVREAHGSVEEVTKKLEAAATANKFGVLGFHDLQQTMNAKGVEFGRECRILEVCNPGQAKEVLEADLVLSNVLPCRISVYETAGKVEVSMLKPTAVMALIRRPGLQHLAQEVEDTMIRIIDAACR